MVGGRRGAFSCRRVGLHAHLDYEGCDAPKKQSDGTGTHADHTQGVSQRPLQAPLGLSAPTLPERPWKPLSDSRRVDLSLSSGTAHSDRRDDATGHLCPGIPHGLHGKV
jgi:hypothetical protein